MKRTWIAGAAVVGAIAAAAATVAAIAESLGRLPPTLFEIRTLWDTNNTLWEVPLQFFVAAWFISIARVYRSRFASVTPAVPTLTWMSAAIVIGTCVWLFTRRVLPTAIFVSGLAAIVVFLGAAVSRRDEAFPAIGLRALVQSDAVRVSVAMALACIAVTASVIRVTMTRVPDAVSTERNVRRWYESRQGRVTGETKRALSLDNSVQVVAFTSYGWQPFRNTVLDRIALVHRFQERGLDVHFTSRAFPLDPACNSGIRGMTIVSHAACEAAYAVRYVRDTRGDEESARFEQWLYARSTVLDLRLIHSRLEQLGVLAGFRSAYEEVTRAVARDISIGKQLGVTGAPSYVVNGVRVPTTESALRAILTLEAERRQHDLRLTSTGGR
ncbi:MAG: DsbA family protein [Vicinamibacterales bacterium]